MPGFTAVNIFKTMRRMANRKVLSIVVILFILAFSISLYFLVGRDPGVIAYLTRYGYLGAFIISLIGNASVFFFFGATLPILASLGAVIYPATGIYGPVIVGLAGGVGAAIGEIAGYYVGYSGRRLVKDSRRYQQLVGWMRRWGFLAIFVFSLLPLIFDVVAITAGILHVPLLKYVIACWLGRSILYVTVIVLTALGLQIVFPGLSL